METTNYAKFDKGRYDLFDGKAKDALVSYLEQEGHTIKRVKEDYCADVVSIKDGETFYSEAEVKTPWEAECQRSGKSYVSPVGKRGSSRSMRRSRSTYFVVTSKSVGSSEETN